MAGQISLNRTVKHSFALSDFFAVLYDSIILHTFLSSPWHPGSRDEFCTYDNTHVILSVFHDPELLAIACQFMTSPTILINSTPLYILQGFRRFRVRRSRSAVFLCFKHAAHLPQRQLKLDPLIFLSSRRYLQIESSSGIYSLLGS